MSMSAKLKSDAIRRWEPAKGRANPSKTYTYQARNGLYYAGYLTTPDAREDFLAGRLKPTIKYPALWAKQLDTCGTG